MNAGMLLAAALVGPGFDTVENEPQVVAQRFDPAIDQLKMSPARLREIYRDLLRSSARRAQADPFAIAPKLIDLFNMIPHVSGVSHSEKRRMRGSIKSRLQDVSRKLALDRATGRSRFSPRDHSKQGAASLNGPAEIRNARDLINLIQSTIAPDSWDVNGGRGSIFFYSPLNVLVIRARGSIHHQVGNTLGQLRR